MRDIKEVERLIFEMEDDCNKLKLNIEKGKTLLIKAKKLGYIPDTDEYNDFDLEEGLEHISIF